MTPITGGENDKKKYIDEDDQMHLIMKVLGESSENDLSFLTNDYNIAYVRKLERNN